MAGHLKKATLSAGIAHLSVGPDETPFDVHLELLCDCSPYFDALFKDRAESNAPGDPINLPDVDPDTFAEVVSWMYRGAISPDMESCSQVIFPMQLWVLAETFEMPALQKAALSACEKRIERVKDAVIGAETVSFIYAQTTSGSPLRELALDTWATRATSKRYAWHKDKLPREFLEELCGYFIGKVEGIGAPDPLKQNFPYEKAFCKEFFAQDSVEEPLFSRQQEDPGLATPATPEQMQNRKVKSLSPRFRGSSPASHTTLVPVFTPKAGEVKDSVKYP